MRLAVKIFMVMALTLAILIPLSMIRGVIGERQQYRAEAVRKVSAGIGGKQVVGGPVLVVPYEETVEENFTGDDGIARKVLRRKHSQWTFFPDTLAIDGVLKPDSRKSGLFVVNIFEWNGRVDAHFDVQIPADDGVARRRIGQPWLSLGIADVVGLRDTTQFTVNGIAVKAAQGIGHADGPGIHTRLSIPQAGGRLRLDARVGLLLQGAETFAMMPYGASNDLRVHSSWPHPKFDGKSPQQDIGGKGFRANWQIAAVATNAQRHYLQQPSLLADKGTPPDAVSVSLFDPVNPYTLADRATKYGLLFVLLTFVGFFMFELIKQVRVHPIQYLLVGMAIAIFFLLLVSLSERIDFGLSYLIAALACIGLIGFYLSAVLRSTARGLGFAAMLGALYAALYGLLLSEDNALVMGAGLLFAILAAIMVATRKVDWSQLSAKAGTPGGAI